ncbi:hypothetical protein [Enterococcus sp. DIV0187]
MNKKDMKIIKSVIELMKENNYELNAASQRDYNEYIVSVLQKIISSED